MKRCLVCNAESFHLDFCSQECQNEFSILMEEIHEDNQLTEEQECELLSDYVKEEEE